MFSFIFSLFYFISFLFYCFLWGEGGGGGGGYLFDGDALPRDRGDRVGRSKYLPK